MNYQFMADRIQAVIRTLGELEIKSTYANMDKLLGSMQMLTEIRNELREVKTDGNADAE